MTTTEFEKIDKLLKTRNLENQVLGIILANELLGKYWMKCSLTFNEQDNNNPYLSPPEFKYSQEGVVLFDGYFVRIGRFCLEYLEGTIEPHGFLNKKILHDGRKNR